MPNAIALCGVCATIITAIIGIMRFIPVKNGKINNGHKILKIEVDELRRIIESNRKKTNELKEGDIFLRRTEYVIAHNHLEEAIKEMKSDIKTIMMHFKIRPVS